MKQIGTLKRKVAWRLGRYGSGYPIGATVDDDRTVKAVPVVQGSIRPVEVFRSRSAVDVIWETDDEQEAVSAPSATLALLQAVCSGDLTIQDGAVTGRFTFQKQGSTVSIVPLTDEPWEACP